MQRLSGLGLESVYHWTRNEPQGQEREPTLAWSGRGAGRYHVDYVFLPRRWLPRVRGCTIGGDAPWSTLSDHAPVVVELKAA